MEHVDVSLSPFLVDLLWRARLCKIPIRLRLSIDELMPTELDPLSVPELALTAKHGTYNDKPSPQPGLLALDPPVPIRAYPKAVFRDRFPRPGCQKVFETYGWRYRHSQRCANSSARPTSHGGSCCRASSQTFSPPWGLAGIKAKERCISLHNPLLLRPR
jgi:hypothetical protein